MRKFRYVPAITTLLAGFVACVIMILEKYTLVSFLWILAAVMISFYIAGLVIRILLNKAFKDIEKEDDKEPEGDEDGENSDKDESSSPDDDADKAKNN